MSNFVDSVVNFVQSTKIPEQVSEVDFNGLFTNPWFMVPFVALMVYMLYKQSWRDIILIWIFIGVWWVTGTDYMSNLVDGDELKLGKVLPVMFGGATVLGVVIYLLFGRSD